MHILLDLDGLLADFFTDALTQLGRRFLAEKSPDGLSWLHYPKGVWWLHELLNIPDAHIWDNLDMRMFSRLEPLPDMQEIISVVEEFDPQWEICTACPYDMPDRIAYSAVPMYKIQWMQKHFGLMFDRFHITRHKMRFANQETVLIDDHSFNTTAFEERNGHAILYPRPWNNATFPVTMLDSVSNRGRWLHHQLHTIHHRLECKL